MKVFVLGILLVCLYCIEGAVVKREAEEEPAATTVQPFLSRYFPDLTDYFQNYAAQTQHQVFNEYLTAICFQTLFHKLQEHFAGEQVTERFTQAFNTMLESARSAMQ